MRIDIKTELLTLPQTEEICEMLGLERFLYKLTVEYTMQNVSETEYYAFDGETLRVGSKGGTFPFRSFGELAKSQGKPFEISEQKSFGNLGAMLDCSRNGVPTTGTVRKMIRYLSVLGYDSLQLYTEDTYEVKGEPYFGYLRGGYSEEELRVLDDYACSYGIQLIPCVQTLAHLGSIFRWKPYAAINDVNDILLVDDERTYELIENIFAAVSRCFRSKLVNIGMDEAFLLGFGNYAKLHGAPDRVELMKRHLARVNQIATKFGFTCMMWSDMFYRLAFGSYYSEDCGEFTSEFKNCVPDGVNLVYWDYYSKDAEHIRKILRQHKRLGDKIWFAGGAWTWLGFLPNNSFSIEAAKASVEACREEGVGNYFLTMWGDYGDECSPFAVLPAMTAAAEYSRGKFDDENFKAKVSAVCGLPLEAFLLLEGADKIGNLTNADFSDPSKYLLYNDCFSGALDTTVTVKDGSGYAALSKQLSVYAGDERWGYIFACAKSLADVLEIKVTLGIRTRALYRAGYLEGIGEIARDDYAELARRLRVFYSDFDRAWHADKRPHGFEISNYRLGGLIARVEHCMDTLRRYASGQIGKIDELETELLDFFGNETEYVRQLAYLNEFKKLASVNDF